MSLIVACDTEIVVKEVDINEPNPTISDTPAIELIEIIPTTVQQFKDPIKFFIQYTDGDGDLEITDL